MAEGLGDLDYCYLITTGRITGRSHEIEIWFALHDGVVYLLSGGGDGSDWVRNLVADPRVTVRIDAVTCEAAARVVTDEEEDALARRLLVGKYSSRSAGDLTEWGRTALPVAVDWETRPPRAG